MYIDAPTYLVLQISLENVLVVTQNFRSIKIVVSFFQLKYQDSR